MWWLPPTKQARKSSGLYIGAVDLNYVDFWGFKTWHLAKSPIQCTNHVTLLLCKSGFGQMCQRHKHNRVCIMRVKLLLLFVFYTKRWKHGFNLWYKCVAESSCDDRPHIALNYRFCNLSRLFLTKKMILWSKNGLRHTDLCKHFKTVAAKLLGLSFKLIGNYDWSRSKLSVGNGSAFLIGRTQVSWYGGGCCWEGRLNRKQGCCVSNSVWPETRGIESLGPGFSENLLLAVNKANLC